MAGGDFSPEAYEQLREAYAKQTNTQLDAETEGVKVGGQDMTLETMPVDSPWKSKIENWEYPNGRSQYMDGKQDPAEVLALMRGAAQEIDDAEKLEEAKEVVAEAEAEEAEAEEVEEESTEEDEELEEMSDEEFDKFIQDIIDEVDEEEVEEDIDGVAEEELSEEEAPEEEAAPEAEAEEAEEEEEVDPAVIAEEISRLKAELDNLRFVPTEEQPQANDEPA